MTLVAGPLLLDHAVGLALVWAWICLAGIALTPWLRLRAGLAALPLVGTIYWIVALYLFRFPGGLDVAAALIAVIAGVTGARWWRGTVAIPLWKCRTWSTLFLFIGSIPYLSTLLFHYVPFGMDASMYTTSATLIAGQGGLPENYAPFAPEVTFPPMNLGVPTLAAMAIRWGSDPAAAMLACHHVTFTLLILATYLLLRNWLSRMPSAILAVSSVWLARASQSTIEWGGFPSVFSVALGIFAVCLLWQQSRGATWRQWLATGAAIAAVPLTHGVGGGLWLYCAAPWIIAGALAHSRNRMAYVRGVIATGLVAAGILGVYRTAGSVDVQQHHLEWTREWQKDTVTLEGNTFTAAVKYLLKNTGTVIVALGLAACAFLFLCRSWMSASLILAGWISIVVIVANAEWWVLPASFLLYPERALYFAAPLAALAVALALRTKGLDWTTRWNPIIASAALVLAAYHHNVYYQKIVRLEHVGADGWEALTWARDHLRPAQDFVRAEYNTAGSYLPGIAQIGCTGAHNHHFLDRQIQAMAQHRTVTHLLIDQARAPASEPVNGAIVFRNRTITIVEMDPPLARQGASQQLAERNRQ